MKNAPFCPRCGHPMHEEVAPDFAGGLARAVLSELVDEDPLVARALDLIFALERIAPAVAAWRELPEATRGPMPPVEPGREEAVQRIMVEMQRVSGELSAREERLVH